MKVVPTQSMNNVIPPKRTIVVPQPSTDKEMAKLIQHFQTVLVEANDLLEE